MSAGRRLSSRDAPQKGYWVSEREAQSSSVKECIHLLDKCCGGGLMAPTDVIGDGWCYLWAPFKSLNYHESESEGNPSNLDWARAGRIVNLMRKAGSTSNMNKTLTTSARHVKDITAPVYKRPGAKRGKKRQGKEVELAEYGEFRGTATFMMLAKVLDVDILVVTKAVHKLTTVSTRAVKGELILISNEGDGRVKESNVNLRQVMECCRGTSPLTVVLWYEDSHYQSCGLVGTSTQQDKRHLRSLLARDSFSTEELVPCTTPPKLVAM